MRKALLVLAAAVALGGQTQTTGGDAGRRLFEVHCAACHGADGAGGERGPSILAAPGRPRSRSRDELRELIRNGVPAAGMPGFRLPDAEMEPLLAYVRSLNSVAVDADVPGEPAAGEAFFFGKGNCSACHMVYGRGGLAGPDLSNLGSERRLGEIEQALRDPNARIRPGYRVVRVRLRDGRAIRGLVRNESNYDLQLQDLDGRFHLLLREEIADLVREERSLMPAVEAMASEMRNLLAFLSRLSGPRPVPAPAEAPVPVEPPAAAGTPAAFERITRPAEGEWPSYNGRLSGNRHSPLRQINASNVGRLAPRWIFSIHGSQRLETTPLVADGVMYVTAVNEVYALDARTGRQLWHYEQPRTRGLVGDAAGGINRGVAVLGDRLFLATDHAHLLALHRVTGRPLFDVEMADYRHNYGATSAPLVVNDLVVSGTSGGDEGVRGFVAAYRASSGERAWRFWTIPAPGEPLAETWRGKALDHGCASAWLTGTYDPGLGLLYWPTGNPCPDFNGDEREGDNLYSDSVLALDARSGKLRWHFQFTPHDVHDWDAQQTPMLVDAVFSGQPRHLLVQANRNGFFYVLDRATGELLLARPFVGRLTWASGIGRDGRPHVLPGTDPTPEGVKVCPAVEGATNWMASAFNPDTGLFYVMALEKCSIYTKSAAVWQPQKSYYGGATREVPDEPGKKYLRAINLQTGSIAWEYPQTGPANTWGGVLSTAGGLVFFGDDSGALAAVDARSGRPLWHFHTSELWKASPMTYLAGGRQYVAVAAGSNIVAFALSPE